MWRNLQIFIIRTSAKLEAYFPILLLYLFLFVIIPYESGGIVQLIEVNGVMVAGVATIWIVTHVFRR